MCFIGWVKISSTVRLDFHLFYIYFKNLIVRAPNYLHQDFEVVVSPLRAVEVENSTSDL